jgi:hypothetical protein
MHIFPCGQFGNVSFVELERQVDARWMPKMVKVQLGYNPTAWFLEESKHDLKRTSTSFTGPGSALILLAIFGSWQGCS